MTMCAISVKNGNLCCLHWLDARHFCNRRMQSVHTACKHLKGVIIGSRELVGCSRNAVLQKDSDQKQEIATVILCSSVGIVVF